MPSGIEFFNDNNSVILSTDVTPLCFHSKTSHTLTKDIKSSIPLHVEDGYLSAFKVHLADSSRILDYGMFSPMGTNGYYFLADKLQNGQSIIIDEYKFKLGLSKTTNKGLQLFDAHGNEVYNSSNKPINILGRNSVNISDCWLKDANGQFTGQYTNKFLLESYPDRKIGILFTNIPTGLIKFSHQAGVHAYDVRMVMDNDFMILMYWVQQWTVSFSSVHIPVDESLRLEYFIVDLTGL